MRLSISDTNLARVIARFRPRRNAKIEFNVNNDGVDIMANQDGWLTLAKWCLIMAHPEMHETSGPDDPKFIESHLHFSHDLVDDEMLAQGRAIEAFWPLDADHCDQDVRFWRSSGIGRDFAPPPHETGNSPMSAIEAQLALNRYHCLVGLDREAVDKQLGSPTGLSPHGQPVYRAEVPGGYLEVDFAKNGKVRGYSF